jgi:hypothetical protein
MGLSEWQRLHETMQCAKFGTREINTKRITGGREGLVDSSAYNGCVLTNEDKQWISERLGGVSEKIEKVETILLTEFHKWASPQEMRQRTHAAAIRALDAEAEALGDRVNKIEGR